MDAAGPGDDGATGLAEADVRLDPFTPRDLFARAVGGGGLRTWYDRCRIAPYEPLDTGADRRIDLDAIVKKGAWVGAVKAPRVKTADEYPTKLEEQLHELERQFILRNLDRYEMAIDLDEPLPLDKRAVERTNLEATIADIRNYQHQAPKLLDTMSVDAVRGELEWRHHFSHELRWGYSFGFEVKKHITGPLWKYDPEAPETLHLAAAIEDEIKGRVKAPDDGSGAGGGR